MATIKQRRAYDKRRYEKWATNHTARLEERRRWARRATVGLAVVVTAAAAGGVGFITRDSWMPEETVEAACPTPGSTAATDLSWDETPSKTLADGSTWTWDLTTSCGDVTVELDGAAAPQAVSSTVFLTQQGFYSNISCHRLTTSGIYVLQCGDPAGDGTGGPGYEYGPLENVPDDYVYEAGTVAMARGTDADTQGSQFFIVYEDSTIGDASSGGYTVIGKITSGLDIVQKVVAAGVDADAATSSSESDGAPALPIAIVSAAVTEGTATEETSGATSSAGTS